VSYLHPVRLAFSGRFQADPSTVNNDVRHYDNASFKAQYQDYQSGDDADGWWNPSGSGAFRLKDCVVRQVWYGDGSGADDPAKDPAVGLAVLDSNDRTAGKIVDLDPQWQLASQLWGLRVRLTDLRGQDGAATWLASSYVANPFRDLWFSRVAGLRGDAAASAIFQSVLGELAWGRNPASRFIDELRAATQSRLLSIRLVTYAYKDDHAASGFTLGRLSGVIGPYLAGEPKSIVAGRRFAPANGNASPHNLMYFTGQMAPGGRLLVDLCNALPLDGTYQPQDLGPLTVGMLLDAQTAEGAAVTAANFAPIGAVPYQDPDWLLKSGGVAAFELTPDQIVHQSPGSFLPLALASQPPGQGAAQVEIRETPGGLFVGAEPFVLRIDSEPGKSVAAETTLYATAFGAPAAGAALQIGQTGQMDGLGGGYGANQPTAPIPPAGVPTAALTLPAALIADDAGRATLTLAATAPGAPRGYIDGQLYNVTYQQAGQTPSDLGPFEVVAIHLRDAYPVSDEPTWTADIAPMFLQFANLYPIMSRRLVRLSDPVSVYDNRALLSLAFSLPIEDPNYMPVTRDLSEGRRRTIVKWLARIDEDAGFQSLLAVARAAAAPALPTATPRAEPGVSEGGKTVFARALAASRASPGA
jgi:hypothetical protein